MKNEIRFKEGHNNKRFVPTNTEIEFNKGIRKNELEIKLTDNQKEFTLTLNDEIINQLKQILKEN